MRVLPSLVAATVWLVIITCGPQPTEVSALDDTQQQQRCRVSFPESYYVSTGTTIPKPDGGTPVAQSGSIYVDGTTGHMRIDQFHLGSQHTFIADVGRQRAYVFQLGQRGKHKHSNQKKTKRDENDHNDDDGTDGDDDDNAVCRVFAIKGAIGPLCIPPSSLRDAEDTLVRGVPVSRYAGYDRADGRLLQTEHFVLNTSEFGVVPWRVQTRYRPGAEVREIAGAPLSRPNWRFFGEPLFYDEVGFPQQQQEEEGDGADLHLPLTAFVSEYSTVTVDFYNFVSMPPDRSVFTIPYACVHAEQLWEKEKAAGDGAPHPDCRAADPQGGGPYSEGSGCPLQYDIQSAQRFLIGWSVLMSRRE